MNLAEQTPPAKPAAQRFTKICAWCRCELGPLPYDATNHSFGICVSCFALYYGELLDDPEAPADSWQSPFGRAGRSGKQPSARSCPAAKVMPGMTSRLDGLPSS